MEKRSGIVLRHKKTGLYFNKHAEHGKELWQAWRFPDLGYLQIWFDAHSYAPNQGDYEPIEIEQTIATKEEAK